MWGKSRGWWEKKRGDRDKKRFASIAYSVSGVIFQPSIPRSTSCKLLLAAQSLYLFVKARLKAYLFPLIASKYVKAEKIVPPSLLFIFQEPLSGIGNDGVPRRSLFFFSFFLFLFDDFNGYLRTVAIRKTGRFGPKLPLPPPFSFLFLVSCHTQKEITQRKKEASSPSPSFSFFSLSVSLSLFLLHSSRRTRAILRFRHWGKGRRRVGRHTVREDGGKKGRERIGRGRGRGIRGEVCSSDNTKHKPHFFPVP